MPFRVPYKYDSILAFGDLHHPQGWDPNADDVRKYRLWLLREVALCDSYLLPPETVKLPDEEQ